MSQKGLESHPSSYLQLCDLGQVTFLCLNSFPSFVTFWDCCVLVERMRRERLDNATWEPGTGKHSECPRVSNGYCSISLDFLWEEMIWWGCGLNPTCKSPPLPGPVGTCGPRSHNPRVHSQPGFWAPASCSHPTSLPDPWPKFIHPGFSTPVSLTKFSLPVSGCSILGSAYLLSRSILVYPGVSPCEDLLEAEPWSIKPSVPCFQVGLLGLFSSRWCSLEDPSSLRNKLPGITWSIHEERGRICP